MYAFRTKAKSLAISDDRAYSTKIPRPLTAIVQGLLLELASLSRINNFPRPICTLQIISSDYESGMAIGQCRTTMFSEQIMPLSCGPARVQERHAQGSSRANFNAALLTPRTKPDLGEVKSCCDESRYLHCPYTSST